MTTLQLSLPAALAAQGTRADYERAERVGELFRDKVAGGEVDASWLANGDRFWYRRELAAGRSEYVVVEAASGERRPAFDHARLAAGLAAASGEAVDAERLRFEAFELDGGGGDGDEGGEGGTVRFNAFDKGWEASLESYELKKIESLERAERGRRGFRGGRRGFRGRRRGQAEATSPDGRWVAFVRDANVHVRAAEGEGDETIALSSEGTEDDGYGGQLHWSPDSQKLIAVRTAREEERTIYMVESSPRDQVQPKLQERQYLKPGDRIALSTPHLFDVAARREIPIDDDLFANPWRISDLRWQPDGRRFTFLYNERGHQVLRVVAVDAETGEAGAIVDERSETFLDYSGKSYLNVLDGTNELIWMSERDGWNHLYLYDTRSGQVKNQITRGSWVVRGVERVDEERRQVWFRAGGIYPEQDPYYVHHCRIDLDGSNLVILTAGNGTHEVELSPDGRYLIDTYSRVDLPPVTELRRADDGSLVRELERADWSALLATGWQVPERFVAKGRDGETDIYGVIFRPMALDPSRSYPVIERIYAGPHSAHVPKSFRSYDGAQALAELGFVVVQIDGMGTSHRSKAFHDVCWRNLKDAGFPDRIPWIRAAAAKYPYLDTTRVGIFGGSAGGQNALAALLHHGDFYTVAVADCGCHDNRMDKVWWNELWMGWPVGKEYEDNSNVTHADKLTGKLLLTVGELDTNVDPASTLQVVDALIRAGKDFDFLLVPGAGHGVGSSLPYAVRRQRDFFVRHLHGVEPRREAGDDTDAAPEKLAATGSTLTAGTSVFAEGASLSASHRLVRVEGWSVHVDERLLAGGASEELGREALQVLADELRELARAVPTARLEALRAVPIWLDDEHELTSMQYHPSTDWLEEHGYEPAMVKSVHIPRASGLIRHARSNAQPWVLLHELAHAYHDRVLGFDDRAIRESFERVVAAGLYERVLHIGGEEQRHYALSNHKEYFAEMSEAFFGTNDFYPFVSAELKTVDPETYRLLERVWSAAGE